MLRTVTQLGIIQCIGNDAKAFLQGQLTANLATLGTAADNNHCLAAHCSIKGRMTSLFLLIQQSNNHYFLLLPNSMTGLALENLQKYAAFSSVELTDVTHDLCLVYNDINSDIAININSNNIDHKTILAFAKLFNQFNLWLCKRKSLIATDLDLVNSDAYWQFKLIYSGIPSVYPETSDLFIPQRVNLQELGGLSFKKGCYLGQEVLSRLHYRGQVKYKLALATFDSNKLTIAPVPASKILNQEQATIGIVVDSIIYNNKGYIIFEKKLAETQCYYDQIALKLIELPYKINTNS